MLRIKQVVSIGDVILFLKEHGLNPLEEDVNEITDFINNRLQPKVRDGTWLGDVIQAMKNLGGSAHYTDLAEEVKRIRKDNGHSLPKSTDEVVRFFIYTNSQDSSAYNGQHGKDIFYSVHGLGEGVWGLR